MNSLKKFQTLHKIGKKVKAIRFNHRILSPLLFLQINDNQPFMFHYS